MPEADGEVALGIALALEFCRHDPAEDLVDLRQIPVCERPRLAFVYTIEDTRARRRRQRPHPRLRLLDRLRFVPRAGTELTYDTLTGALVPVDDLFRPIDAEGSDR